MSKWGGGAQVRIVESDSVCKFSVEKGMYQYTYPHWTSIQV